MASISYSMVIEYIYMTKKILYLIILVLIIIGAGYFMYLNIYYPEGKVFNTDIKYRTIIKCRPGLDMLSYYKVPSDMTDDQCKINQPLGNLSRVCSNCGNNVCEAWENICTCPSDCK